MDQLARLQYAGGLRDADASNAEHVGEHLVRRTEFIRMRAVSSHEQTTGKPLLDQVKPGACGSARQQAHPHLQVTMQPAAKSRAPSELATERRTAQSPRKARALNDRTQR